jgi:hypothetical protein
VSLVPVGKLEGFMDKLKQEYYKDRIDLKDVDQYLFSTSPSVGACWFKL